VKVTDANLCNTFSDHQPDPTCSSASVGQDGDVALLCFGDTNGTGTFTASGGTAPYTFSITAIQLGNHEHDSDHVELYERWSREHHRKVTDANLCNTSANHQPDPTCSSASVGKTGDVALLCFGDTNGTGTFTASGGTAPYTFSITSNSAGATTSTTATR